MAGTWAKWDNRWIIWNESSTHTWFRIDTHNGKSWHLATNNMDDLAELIRNNTCGKFFFGDRSIFFEQEKDAVMFQLKYTSKI